MHLERLWFAVPAIPLLVTLVTSLRTGRILNPMRGANPMIVARSQQPQLFWLGFGVRVMILLASVWLSAQLLFFTP
jgi:hypothetical protein